MDDTYRFEYFGLIAKQGHVNPITPIYESKTLAIPGRVGLWDYGTEIREKRFSFPLAIIEYDRTELQRKLNDFVAFLFDAYGKPRNIKVVFDYEPDKYYMMRLAEAIDIERTWNTADFTLNMVAYDPHKKFIVPSNEITWGSDVPILSDILWCTGITNWSITTPQTFEVINNGNVSTLFAFTLNGTGDNVTFSANGKTMTLGSFNNKTITVNNNYTVKVNGVDDLTISNGVFLTLLPGRNQITVTGSNLNLTISENLTYQYL